MIKKGFVIITIAYLMCFVQQSNAQLYINEVMSDNSSTIADNAGEYDDWLEVYNASNSAIDLAGYYFTDDLGHTTKWKIPNTNPSKTTLPANGYKIFWADENETQGEDHLNFKIDSSGEGIYIFKPDSTIENGFTFPPLAVNQSYGRNTDGDALLVLFSQSTPAAANTGGIPLVAKAQISPASGIYNTNQQITISCVTPAANIYYTTDGSIPTTNSNLYTGPFSVGSSVSIRALAVKQAYTNSEIVTESLIFYSTNLPIVSITTAPSNLWDDYSGIHVVGNNGDWGSCMPNPANFNQNWEKPANIVMLETDGSLAFNTNAGISISGGCSRRSPQKSFNVATKSVYGSSNFKHRIFPQFEQDKYKRFKLRNGGTEFNGLHMRDVIGHDIIEGEIDLDSQRSRASVVFINGQYWGVMYIRDAFSEHWINENHKIADKDSIDLLQPYGNSVGARVLEGSTTDYVDLFNYINQNDLSNSSNYTYVQSKIDINEYINYWIIEIYTANIDWPMGNVKIWKEQLPQSKFRWLFYDIDWSFGLSRDIDPSSNIHADVSKNMLLHATNAASSGWPNDGTSTLIFRKLLDNANFKNEFIQRFATQMETIYEKNRCQAIADERYNEVITEKQAHFDRWKNEFEEGSGNSMDKLNMATWQSEFDYVRNWFAERKPHMESHLLSYFGLAGTYVLNIPVTSVTNGSVLLNENEYKAPYNYSGKYFNDVPVRIRAVAAPGYRFSYWLENGSTNEVQTITTNGNITRTPVFEPAEELVINEIFYNPPGASESTEFVEIYNPDSKALSLSGYYFDEGICFNFPDGATIAAGEYIIVAKNESVYTGNAYQVFQWYDSSLNNDGELLVFKNPANEVIDSVRYNDNINWSQQADGEGYSLALLNYNLNNELPDSWNRQLDTHTTTPGSTNIFCQSNINLNATKADISCNGASDGFIYINPTGITLPFTSSWNNGSTTPTITNLDAGIYTLTIKDALMCEKTESFTITEQAALAVTNIAITNASSNNAANGSIDLTLSGGTPPYTYFWSTAATSQDVNNLNPNNYWVSIVDNNSCQLLLNNLEIGLNCLASIIQQNNPMLATDVYRVSDFIQSNGLVDINKQVSFKANNYIELMNSFEVINGAEFEAVIDGCQ